MLSYASIMKVVNSEDEEKFLDAAKEGDVASVITLVRNGIDVNVRDRRERVSCPILL